MKNSDWALVVLIVAIVGVASYYLVNIILPPPNQQPKEITTAELISPDIITSQPSDLIFNDDAINPTVPVTIGTLNKEELPQTTAPFTLGQGN
jgi:hypothetical protein